jgi:glucokinase
MILAGDVGGTRVRLRLAPRDAAGGAVAVDAEYRVADFADPGDAIAAFLQLPDVRLAGPSIESACFAVAGPVAGPRAQLTNAPWTLDADDLARRFAIPQVRLVNDFYAAAAGIDELAPAMLVTLQDGDPDESATRLVIGAGTGLGVAYAVRIGARFHLVAGEGGHVGFAPVDDLQVDLWRYLHARHGRVTAEHVVSGAGLVNVYAFLLARDRSAATAPLPPAIVAGGAAAVAHRAVDGDDAVARQALDLFVSTYGAVAGDHALSAMARAGVYIVGGIAPRIAPLLREGGFMRAFVAKAPHASLMRRMPVRLVLDERLGVLGATRLARERSAPDAMPLSR